MTNWIIAIALSINILTMVDLEHKKEILYEIVIEDYFEKEDIIIEEVELEDVNPTAESKDSTREVIFSNYYTGDGSSGDITASGLNSGDFQVNSMGMYTYQGKVVLATANMTRLLYDMPSGFVSNELYDEMVIVFRGIEYEAIVLDVCGTCTWGKSNEKLQRVDIFTTHKIMGVEQGEVKENNE